MTQPIITQEYLKECIHYERKTGLVTWKLRPVHHFTDKKESSAHTRNKWNSRHAGNQVGSLDSSNGYLIAGINYKKYYVHRIIWLLIYGKFPKEIDHINRVKTDNRLCNIRSVNRSTNNKNHPIPSNNTSGVCGVHWYKRVEKWVVRINVNNESIYLGYYSDFFEAVCARKSAEAKYGFHPNHGMERPL